MKGLTLRAIIIAAVFTFLAAKWIQVSELIIGGCFVTESVPPIPAVAALIFLAIAIPLSRKVFGKRSLTSSEGMTIFAMMAVGVTVMGFGGVSYLFITLLPLFYFATPANQFADYQKYVPGFFHPRDPQIINSLFEGSWSGAAPWAAWLPYLFLWGGFYLVLFFTMTCLMRIVYDYWVRQERLTFPIVQLVTSLGYGAASHDGEVPFFRNPLVWVGVGLAFLYDGMNVMKAFNPDFPALVPMYSLEGIFRDRPWNALGSLYFRWDPALTGMGYLMSTEVLLSVIAGYFFSKMMSVAASAIGNPSLSPARRLIGGGAFFAIAVHLVWGARKYLSQSISRALGRKTSEEGRIPLSPRWAVQGVVIGGGLVFLFFLACRISLAARGISLSLWPLAAYLTTFFILAFVYARVRAETGAPMSWLYPHAALPDLTYNLIGVKTVLQGRPANVIMIAHMWFLARSFFQSEAAVQVENFRIGEISGVSSNAMAAAGMIGLGLGLLWGFYVHLSAYYHYGLNTLHLPTYESVFGDAISRIKDPGSFYAIRNARIFHFSVGAVATASLILARKAFFRFPLHPLGLAMGLAYGEPVWAPFFLAWLFKTVTLRTGGMKLYRRLTPLFIGLVVGHYFAGGVVWGLLGLTGKEVFSRFRVDFGFQGYY